MGKKFRLCSNYVNDHVNHLLLLVRELLKVDHRQLQVSIYSNQVLVRGESINGIIVLKLRVQIVSLHSSCAATTHIFF